MTWRATVRLAAGFLIATLLLAVMLAACSRQPLDSRVVQSEPPAEPDPEPPPEDPPEPPAWTVLVYMNADNDLESQAIADINELERGEWPQAAIYVLADRADGYDTSNGDWRDTRLLRIEHDPADDGVIRSPRIDAPLLGIDAEESVELNLGHPAVLVGALQTVRAVEPSASSALILWGHGSGWRASPHAVSPRAFGLDESADDALLLHELGGALEQVVGESSDSSLSLVGMDLCYGAMLETVVEIAPFAGLLVASEGIVPASGWDYADLLSRLSTTDGGDPEPVAFAQAVVDSAAAAWSSHAGTTISAIRLSAADELVSTHNALCDALFVLAEPADQRTALSSLLWSGVEDYYSTPGDLNLDVGHLAMQVADLFPAAGPAAEGFLSQLAEATVAEWHHEHGNPSSTGLAVHYCALDAAGLPAGHDVHYFRDYPTSTPLRFVQASSWVPVYEAGPGLLFRLWYEVLP